MKSDIASLRNEYLKSSLEDGDFPSHPMTQFDAWFQQAVNSDELEPNAMALGTVDENNQPHQRTVLLKGVTEEGLMFYTNYKSSKGLQIEINPQVNLLFPWYNLQRQIIICGTAEKLPKLESEEYFHSRPLGAQLSALISDQSKKIGSRSELEKKLRSAEKTYENQEVPLPPNWGGYLVRPLSFEFWQGRENRLHDRIFYRLLDNSTWEISRLAP